MPQVRSYREVYGEVAPQKAPDTAQPQIIDTGETAFRLGQAKLGGAVREIGQKMFDLATAYKAKLDDADAKSAYNELLRKTALREQEYKDEFKGSKANGLMSTSKKEFGDRVNTISKDFKLSKNAEALFKESADRYNATSHFPSVAAYEFTELEKYRNGAHTFYLEQTISSAISDPGQELAEVHLQETIQENTKFMKGEGLDDATIKSKNEDISTAVHVGRIERAITNDDFDTVLHYMGSEGDYEPIREGIAAGEVQDQTIEKVKQYSYDFAARQVFADAIAFEGLEDPETGRPITQGDILERIRKDGDLIPEVQERAVTLISAYFSDKNAQLSRDITGTGNKGYDDVINAGNLMTAYKAIDRRVKELPDDQQGSTRATLYNFARSFYAEPSGGLGTSPEEIKAQRLLELQIKDRIDMVNTTTVEGPDGSRQLVEPIKDNYDILVADEGGILSNQQYNGLIDYLNNQGRSGILSHTSVKEAYKTITGSADADIDPEDYDAVWKFVNSKTNDLNVGADKVTTKQLTEWVAEALLPVVKKKSFWFDSESTLAKTVAQDEWNATSANYWEFDLTANQEAKLSIMVETHNARATAANRVDPNATTPDGRAKYRRFIQELLATGDL